MKSMVVWKRSVAKAVAFALVMGLGISVTSSSFAGPARGEPGRGEPGKERGKEGEAKRGAGVQASESARLERIDFEAKLKESGVSDVRRISELYDRFRDMNGGEKKAEALVEMAKLAAQENAPGYQGERTVKRALDALVKAIDAGASIEGMEIPKELEPSKFVENFSAAQPASRKNMMRALETAVSLFDAQKGILLKDAWVEALKKMGINPEEVARQCG